MAPRSFTWLPLLAAAASALGCREGQSAGHAELRLVKVVPRSSADQIALNDDVRVIFDDVLEDASSAPGSVRLELLVPSGGDSTTPPQRRPVKGRWLVEGRELRFQPQGPLDASLRDGGFQPGSTYELTLSGFPSLSGPRSIRGARLPGSVVHTFTTASRDEELLGDGSGPPGSRLFRDASPGRGAPLEQRPGDEGALESTPLAWDGSLLLACAEPIDPRTLHARDFEVRPYTRASTQPGRAGPLAPAPRTVAVKSITLLRNEDEDAPNRTVGAAALLRVDFRGNLPLRDGSNGYFDLVLRPEVGAGGGPLDYSGTPVYDKTIRFFAARQDRYAPEEEGSYEIDFLSAEDFVPILDPGSDGTAFWSDSGRLEVRYPRAAGSGEAGAVVLGESVEAQDLQATRLHLPKGVTAGLEGAGLVILRAQGRMDIDGELIRRLPAGASASPLWDTATWRSPSERASLSEWLVEARAKDQPVTVLIAGGDLVVKGEIDVETPLLLVAGGMIRGAGPPRAMRDQLWLLGEGGFAVMPHHLDGEASPIVTAPLLIDGPTVNQLKDPLTFVAISSEVPKALEPSDWGAPEVFGHRGKSGTYRVQFLQPDFRGAEGEATELSREERLGQAVRYEEPKDVAAESGGDEGGGSRVRLRFELQLRPASGRRDASLWDPPFVDRVRLSWTPNPR